MSQLRSRSCHNKVQRKCQGHDTIKVKENVKVMPQ